MAGLGTPVGLSWARPALLTPSAKPVVGLGCWHASCLYSPVPPDRDREVKAWGVSRRSGGMRAARVRGHGADGAAGSGIADCDAVALSHFGACGGPERGTAGQQRRGGADGA